MLSRVFCTGLIFLLSICAAQAQQSASDLKKKARDLLAQGRYVEAKAVLSSSRELVRDDKEGRFLLAVTNYQLHLLDEALDQFKALGDNDRYPFPECRLYLAKIYHARQEFAEAGRQYKKYLKSLSASNPLRQAVANEVRRCQNGLDMEFKTAQAFVENLGPEVNTTGDEFGPVPSPTYIDRLYFSSIRQGNTGGRRDERGNPDETNGRYTSDMYSCRLLGGKWGQAQPLPYHLNSPRHEVLIDVNALGNALFYFKGLNLQKGEVLIDTFRQGGAQVLSSDPFIGPFNPLEGDVSFHLYNDTLLIFSSNRAGGLGGYDLYKSSLVNGKWTAPENLGPQINSAFDEMTPYLLRDGRSLFFSSNNSVGSIGGLDIFRSIWDPRTKRWSAPENLGMPLNSSADDTHFRVSRDGFTAFFASSRKDGYGMRDLYVAYFNEFLELDPIVGYDAPAPVTAPPPAGPAAKSTAPSEAAKTATTAPTPEKSAVKTTPPAPTAPTATPPATAPPATAPPPAEPARQPATTSSIWPAAEKLKTDSGAFPEQLKEAVSFMKAGTDIKLTLTAFVKHATPPGPALFSGIRTAEAAAAQLIRQGIAPERIFIRAVPASWNDAEAGSHTLVLRYLAGPGKAAPAYAPLKNALPSATYNAAMDAPVLFKVQVSSLKGEFTGDLLSKHADPMVEKSHGVDFYRYTLGAFTTYAEAEQFRRKLAGLGQSGAFITAYVYGFRLERSAAGGYAGALPELKPFAGN